MSTLPEIESAVEVLPRREQRKLLEKLSRSLGAPAKTPNAAARKLWPVPPPRVSKAESRGIARPIECP